MNNTTKYCKFSFFIFLSTVLVVPSVSIAGFCSIEKDGTLGFDYQTSKKLQRKQYYGNNEEVLAELSDNPELVIQTRDKYFNDFPDEAPDYVDNVFPDTNATSVNKSSIDTSIENEALVPELEGGFGVTIGEALGPVGEVAGVLLWGKGILDTFENESATAFDKAASVLSIVPVVNEILQVIQASVDNRILQNRATHIHASNHPYDTSKKYIMDYNAERLMWKRFADNYYTKYLPTVAKQIVITNELQLLLGGVEALAVSLLLHMPGDPPWYGALTSC